MSSRAIFVDAEGPRWVDRETRDLEPGELRVRVLASPITGLDRDVVFGRTNFNGVPGQCFVGTVLEASGPIGEPLVGQRVVSVGSWGCGLCDSCAAGLEERCAQRKIPGISGADGGHAEQVVLPARGVTPLDEVITDEAGALIPLLAGIYQALIRRHLPPWTNILVIGDGGAGLLASIALASSGYTVTLRGRHGDRFDLVRRYRVNFILVEDERGGALRPGRYGPALLSYPYVVDASGTAEGWLASTELVSPGGTIFMLTSANDVVPRPLHRIQEKSITVVGLREGPIEPAMVVVAQGLFDPTEVVNRVDSFDDALRAYRRADQADTWLSLLRMPA